MNDMTLYWIWLQLRLGSGANVDEGIAFFENPKAVYDATHEQLVFSAAFTSGQIKKLADKNLSDAQKVITECEDIGCGIVTPDSDKYPKALMCMPNYPLVLYTLGDIECLKNKLAISIVGTRRASDSGLEIAGKLSASLCRAGAVVVSGGALGIDSAAHLGALSAGGSTVAVLGCGFNAKYHDGTDVIRDDIEENGALISEYHPSFAARAMNFPIRNRIIAALGMGTVVIEAAQKSGSLITANISADYGRDVFAVPGNAANLIQLGTIGLIRDGATPVFSSSDILNQYSVTYSDLIDWDKVESDLLYQSHEEIDFSKIKYGVKKIVMPKDKKVDEKEIEDIPPATESCKNSIPDGLSPAERAVYEAIAEGNSDSDSIKEKTNLPMSDILVALTTLEISGIIKCPGGHIYKIN
ncbi:MAG: DNA-processing protein DprA [Clostridia bacterium]|nr:DNA-processing protein DprA [Clostridia bacterium]